MTRRSGEARTAIRKCKALSGGALIESHTTRRAQCSPGCSSHYRDRFYHGTSAKTDGSLATASSALPGSGLVFLSLFPLSNNAGLVLLSAEVTTRARWVVTRLNRRSPCVLFLDITLSDP